MVIHSGVNRTGILHPEAVYQSKVLNNTIVRLGKLLVAGLGVLLFRGIGAMGKNVRFQIGGANPFS